MKTVATQRGGVRVTSFTGQPKTLEGILAKLEGSPDYEQVAGMTFRGSADRWVHTGFRPRTTRSGKIRHERINATYDNAALSEINIRSVPSFLPGLAASDHEIATRALTDAVDAQFAAARSPTAGPAPTVRSLAITGAKALTSARAADQSEAQFEVFFDVKVGSALVEGRTFLLGDYLKQGNPERAFAGIKDNRVELTPKAKTRAKASR